MIPEHVARRLLWLPDNSRNMGIHLMAGRGSGKSRLMGRVIGWQDFIRGVPLAILDPAGPTIDNLLDKIIRLPVAEQEQLLRRIVYVDMSGKNNRIVPFPLYYRLGEDESVYEISQRFLDVVRSSDPSLLNAPIQGFNALARIGTYVGMILTALAYQITEAEDLLLHPDEWSERFRVAQSRHPDVAPAVAFFTIEYPAMDKREREMLIRSFLNKISLFSLDPRHKAMFGASQQGIDWYEVSRKRLAVLLDFRRVTDPEERRFKMHWVFHSFFSFIKYRGAGRWSPTSFIIDEMANLSHGEVKSESPFAKALDEFVNVYMRNCMIWFTAAHQELFQLEERIRPTLMSLGTQILGVTSDRDAALAMAKQLVAFDPYMIKRYEPIDTRLLSVSDVIDTRPVIYTPQEQQNLASNQFTTKRLFEFLVRPAAREGDISQTLYNVNIRNFDKDQWPDAKRVGPLRAALAAQTGVPVADILAEIAQRRDAIISSPPAYANDIPPAQAAQEDNDEESLSDERIW